MAVAAVAAAQRWWAAGVLPVALRSTDHMPMVLLGLDARYKGGKWSDFAGSGEPEDASPRHTAVRELREETGGLLTMQCADLESALEFRGTTPSGKTLHRYVVRIQYDERLPSLFYANDEKVALAWFPLTNLPPMRRVFAAQMQQDAQTIARHAVPQN